MMEYTLIQYNWKEYVFHRRSSWNSHSMLGSGLIRRGGKNPDEEKRHDDYTVPQKVHYKTFWKHNQDAVHWVRLSKAQDQGARFWQTKSFATMVYATIPGGRIDRVTAQNGDRVMFDTAAAATIADAAAYSRG